jgi:hypothetical protein
MAQLFIVGLPGTGGKHPGRGLDHNLFTNKESSYGIIYKFLKKIPIRLNNNSQRSRFIRIEVG